MIATVADNRSEASILARVLEAQARDLTPGAAEYLLSIRFPDADAARMNELSHRAQQGTLTADELQELDSYIHVGNFLALMQSKARRRLALTRPQ